jgi:hypothetical protein
MLLDATSKTFVISITVHYISMNSLLDLLSSVTYMFDISVLDYYLLFNILFSFT